MKNILLVISFKSLDVIGHTVNVFSFLFFLICNYSVPARVISTLQNSDQQSLKIINSSTIFDNYNFTNNFFQKKMFVYIFCKIINLNISSVKYFNSI